MLKKEDLKIQAWNVDRQDGDRVTLEIEYIPTGFRTWGHTYDSIDDLYDDLMKSVLDYLKEHAGK